MTAPHQKTSKGGPESLWNSASRHTTLASTCGSWHSSSLASRKRGGHRSFLHAIGQDHEGRLRRIRGRAFSWRAQADDFKAERAQICPFGFFFALSFFHWREAALRQEWNGKRLKKSWAGEKCNLECTGITALNIVAQTIKDVLCPFIIVLGSEKNDQKQTSSNMKGRKPL